MVSPTPRLDAFKKAAKKRLGEVKQRLLWALIAFGLGGSLTWVYRLTIIRWLLIPAQGRLSSSGPPVFTEITEVFNFTTHMALLGGVIAAAPVVVVSIFQFISPILPKKLRRFLLIFLPTALLLFLAGVAFAYVLVLPLVLNFMLSFGEGVAVPMIGLTEYMDLAQTLLLGIGAVFELPLIMFLLAKLRIVSHERMRKVRPYVTPAAFIFSGFISSTIEVTIPIAIIALYEVGLVLAWLARPRPPKPPRVQKPRRVGFRG